MGDLPEDLKLKSLWQKVQQKAGKGKCCNDKELAAYLDHKMPVAEVQKFESHLAVCPSCLNTVKELREVLSGPVLPVPEEVMTKAKDIVRQDPERAWPQIGFWPQLHNAFKGWQAAVPGLAVAFLMMASCGGGFFAGQMIIAEASAGSVSANKLLPSEVNMFNEDELMSSFLGIFAS